MWRSVRRDSVNRGPDRLILAPVRLCPKKAVKRSPPNWLKMTAPGAIGNLWAGQLLEQDRATSVTVAGTRVLNLLGRRFTGD
jgi:hypothetical protein